MPTTGCRAGKLGRARQWIPVRPPNGHATDGDNLVTMPTGGKELPAEREFAWHFPVYPQAYGKGNAAPRFSAAALAA